MFWITLFMPFFVIIESARTMLSALVHLVQSLQIIGETPMPFFGGLWGQNFPLSVSHPPASPSSSPPPLHSPNWVWGGVNFDPNFWISRVVGAGKFRPQLILGVVNFDPNFRISKVGWRGKFWPQLWDFEVVEGREGGGVVNFDPTFEKNTPKQVFFFGVRKLG